jgi:hypothetical protein
LEAQNSPLCGDLTRFRVFQHIAPVTFPPVAQDPVSAFYSARNIHRIFRTPLVKV